jgi:hypothetical protein
MRYLGKEEKAFIYQNMERGRIEYSPFKVLDKVTYVDDVRGVPLVNSYIPPSWETINEGEELPEVFAKFMKHLIPVKEHRRYVYHWLREMMLRRNQTCLVLNSIEGIGKGIFCNIARQLVGRNNFFTAYKQFFKSQFNGELEGKRLIVFDEIEITEAVKNDLKAYANDDINIEKKGQQPEWINNYASFIITNNHDASITALHPIDRRFSIPHVAETKLVNVFSKEEIKELVSIYNDVEKVSKIARFIIKNCEGDKEWDDSFVLITPKFHHLCKSGLPEWARYTIDLIESSGKEMIDIAETREDYEIEFKGRKFGGVAKITSLLDTYVDTQARRFGKVVKREGKYFIQTAEHYLKASEEELDEL